LVLLVFGVAPSVPANAAARDAAATVEMPLIGTRLRDAGTVEPWRTAFELSRKLSSVSPQARAEVQDRYTGRTWEISARYVPRGNDTCRVLVMRDITNMISLEADVRHNGRMAELGRLVGNVAHEVRNPLFSMSATLDALEARLGSNAAIGRYTDNLRRELRRITALMQDLLEYGKPPVLDARVERISGAILDAVAAAAPNASAQGVILRTETTDDGAALIDRARIAQAFQNIIENAVHYAPEGSAVVVRLAHSEVEGQLWLTCSVEDSGPGFPEDVLPMVFEPFYTTRAGGTGLGLSIVQRIVQIHGGMAFVANRDEGGARVTVCLPARFDES
jgi:signal transduction histidine kinase